MRPCCQNPKPKPIKLSTANKQKTKNLITLETFPALCFQIKMGPQWNILGFITHNVAVARDIFSLDMPQGFE